MLNYRVLINDNAHYMDETERTDYGVFANADEAIPGALTAMGDSDDTDKR